MAKRRRLSEPKTRTRERYSMVGNAITGGEHAPVYVHPKQRLKAPPKGGSAIANMRDIFNFGTGLIKPEILSINPKTPEPKGYPKLEDKSPKRKLLEWRIEPATIKPDVKRLPNKQLLLTTNEPQLKPSPTSLKHNYNVVDAITFGSPKKVSKKISAQLKKEEFTDVKVSKKSIKKSASELGLDPTYISSSDFDKIMRQRNKKGGY